MVLPVVRVDQEMITSGVEVVTEAPEGNREIGGVDGVFDVEDHFDAFGRCAQGFVQFADMVGVVFPDGDDQDRDVFGQEAAVDGVDLGKAVFQPDGIDGGLGPLVAIVFFFGGTGGAVDTHFAAEAQFAAGVVEHIHRALGEIHVGSGVPVFR